eukprot:scaffold4390_cov108-Isochrysis_galbana.AAC.6
MDRAGCRGRVPACGCRTGRLVVRAVVRRVVGEAGRECVGRKRGLARREAWGQQSDQPLGPSFAPKAQLPEPQPGVTGGPRIPHPRDASRPIKNKTAASFALSRSNSASRRSKVAVGGPRHCRPCPPARSAERRRRTMCGQGSTPDGSLRACGRLPAQVPSASSRAICRRKSSMYPTTSTT